MKKILTASLLAALGSAFAANITGAGSSFDYPLFSKMFSEYKKLKNDDVNYQSIGSGGGQRQLLAQTVDFGATDGPMSDEQLKSAPGKIVHVPVTLGAVVATYNLPGIDENTHLKMNGKVLADIFLGRTKLWNDAGIAKLNPGVTLPPLPITVVHRSDGSGTSFVFTDFLSGVSPEWKSKVGAATSVQWPTGIGAKGNEGVAGAVKSTPGAIGYTELAYALQNKLAYGSVQNRGGEFVVPTTETTTQAAAGKVIPADTRVSIVNSAKGYPISTFSWVVLYQDGKYGSRSQAQAQAVKDLLSWAVTDGQKYSEDLEYAKLPTNVATRAKAVLATLTYGGQKLK